MAAVRPQSDSSNFFSLNLNLRQSQLDLHGKADAFMSSASPLPQQPTSRLTSWSGNKDLKQTTAADLIRRDSGFNSTAASSRLGRTNSSASAATPSFASRDSGAFQTPISSSRPTSWTAITPLSPAGSQLKTRIDSAIRTASARRQQSKLQTSLEPVRGNLTAQFEQAAKLQQELSTEVKPIDISQVRIGFEQQAESTGRRFMLSIMNMLRDQFSSSLNDAMNDLHRGFILASDLPALKQSLQALNTEYMECRAEFCAQFPHEAPPALLDINQLNELDKLIAPPQSPTSPITAASVRSSSASSLPL